MFIVTQDGKPCDCVNQAVHKRWDSAVHKSYKNAVYYLHRWLGINSPGVDYLRQMQRFELDGVWFNIEELHG